MVEEIGRIAAIRSSPEGVDMDIACRKVLADLKPGDSVAVNGVCLTAVRIGGGGFAAQAMPETVRHTNLARLVPGETVNLERALPGGGRLGGHIVTGHVDATGKVVEMRPEGQAIVMGVEAPPDVRPYLVPRGSVAVDGVSLTVTEVDGFVFRVSLIPHTRLVSNLGLRRVGDQVNLEVDVIARYVYHFLASLPSLSSLSLPQGQAGRGVTEEWLREQGWQPTGLTRGGKQHGI